MNDVSDQRVPTYSWYALGVLFLVYLLNFVDRQILSILANDIKADLQLDDAQLGFLYGTMTILVVSTIIHFYSSSHLTAVTALKSLDGEFEAVSASLKVPFYKTLWRVTLPVCLPSIIDISRYYFVNAMTTISAVVFLYSPKTMLASISIVHLDEAGNVGSASAMATLIVVTSAVVTLASFAAEAWLVRRTQAWRTLRS